ncbi:biotin attachment protein [Saccharopolyspora sp. MS10]|uniref:biotin attachment protein n=1 Tax=Saccharopolyspora sp. MS10 TaxID=3385973 RepID=UPI0039A0AC9F
MLGPSPRRTLEGNAVTDLHFPRPRADPHEPGELLRWLAADGERVRGGEAVAEVRADGRTRAVLAPASGTLWWQGRAGERFTPGSIIGLVE